MERPPGVVYLKLLRPAGVEVKSIPLSDTSTSIVSSLDAPAGGALHVRAEAAAFPLAVAATTTPLKWQHGAVPR